MSYKITYQYGTETTVGTFNSLGTGSTGSLGNVTNSDGAMLMDLAIHLAAQGVARDSGATFAIRVAWFSGGGDATLLVAGVDASTSARDIVLTRIPIPPTDFFTLGITNSTGQTTAASGNSVTVTIYDMVAV